jgi:hypothetical protein
MRGAVSCTGARGGLAEAAPSRAAAESDVELAVGLGVGRRRAEPFVVVGESPGVERREEDCWRAWRDDELDRRSVWVDVVREVEDALGYGAGEAAERCAWTAVLMADTGGVRERSSGPGSEMSRKGVGEPWVEIVGRLLSPETAREWTPDRTMTDSKISDPTGEKVRGDGGVSGRGVAARFSDDIAKCRDIS